jgi:hypothetical protein
MYFDEVSRCKQQVMFYCAYLLNGLVGEEPIPTVDCSYLTIDCFPVNGQPFIVNAIPQLKLRGRVNRPLSVQVTDL